MRYALLTLSLLLALGVQVFGQERPGGGGSGGTANGVGTIAQTNLTLFPTQTNSYAISNSIWGSFVVTNNQVMTATNPGLWIYTGINTNGKVTYLVYADPNIVNDAIIQSWSVSTNFPTIETDNNVYAIPFNTSPPLRAYTNGLGFGGQASYGYSAFHSGFWPAGSGGNALGFGVYGLDLTPRASVTNLPFAEAMLQPFNGNSLRVNTTASLETNINNGQVEVAFYDAADNQPYVCFNYDNFSNGSREGFVDIVAVANSAYGELGGFQGFMPKIATPLLDNGSMLIDPRDPVAPATNDAGVFMSWKYRLSQNPINPDGGGSIYGGVYGDNYGRILFGAPTDPTSWASVTSNSLHFPARVTFIENTNVPVICFYPPVVNGVPQPYSLGSTGTNGAMGFDGKNYYGSVSNATWTPLMMGQAGSTNLSTATTVFITFNRAMPNTNYIVDLVGEGATLAAPIISAKTTTQFTVSMTSFSGVLDWTAILKTQP